MPTQNVHPSTLDIGHAAERAVAEHYIARGYTQLAANFKSYAGKQVGEIDLVFKGPGNAPHVCFVEVRSRSSRAAALSIDMVLPKFKRRRIAQTARYFMYSNPQLANHFWHFDLAIVLLGRAPFDNSPQSITIVADVNLND